MEINNANTIGFTGTRELGTVSQRNTLYVILNELYGTHNILRQGCCIGFDYRAAKIAKEMGYYVIGHPPIKQSLMHPYIYKLCDHMEEPEEYLARDLRIVQRSSLLIAVPATNFEILRSGTWATIRYARDHKIPIIKVLPDGVEQEDPSATV